MSSRSTVTQGASAAWSTAARRVRRRSAAVGLVLLAAGLIGQPVLGATPSGAPGALGSPAAPVATAGPTEPVAAWLYRTELILWDPIAATWYVTYSDGTRVDGLDVVLNGNGAVGWELVALFPEQTANAVVDGLTGQDSRRLRAVYKQRP